MKQAAPSSLKVVKFSKVSFGHYDDDDRSLLQFYADVAVYDEDFELEPIGTVSAYILPAYRSDLDLICDAVNQDVYEAGEFLVREGENYEEFEYASRVLYISSMTIDKERRGKDLGLSTIKAVIETVGYGCQACLMLPCPLGNPKDDVGREKLRKHYARLGFDSYGDSGFVGINLDLRHDFLEASWAH